MKKRAFVMLLASVLLLSVVSSCGEAGTAAPPEEKQTAGQTEDIQDDSPSNTDEYGRDIIASGLPEDLDLGGKTVTFYLRPDFNGVQTAYELVAEEETGEIINDAVFKRNRAVEERLNVKLQIVDTGADSNSSYQNQIASGVLAGDSSFDIASLNGYFGPSLVSGGYFYNLRDAEYLCLDKPWWNSDFVDQITVFDSLYLITGDISLTATNRVFAEFFNKRTFADYYPDIDLYDTVRQGKWTIDYFSQLTKGAYSDINGDGIRDVDDFYAFFLPTASTPIDAFEEALEVPITAKNEEGVPVIVYNSSKTAEAYSKVCSLLTSYDGICGGYYSDESEDDAFNAFVSGRSMFIMEVLITTERMRDLEDDYGVIPIFKWDESQKTYRTAVQDAYSVFAMSAVSSDPASASAVLEAMSEYSYQYVTPAYFEIALKRKYARGENDAEMYDIILAGRGFNFGVVYSENLGDLIHQWRLLLDGRKDNWQSTIEKKMPGIEAKLSAFLDQLKAIGAE
ncbi:MAG: hypothetical protein K6D94_02255 [Clostridiales bacterium]|nr:hypothetical protein [Clostridiales bacterium]